MFANVRYLSYSNGVTFRRERKMKKLKLRLTHLWYKLLMKLGLKSDEVYYIGGSEALPPPLSKDEEQVLLMKLPNGDQARAPF